MLFNYPECRESRRHGPAGYARYESYRPWLRDEFVFQCVYCLKRESWGQVVGEFELDHFKPQALFPEQALNYENLVYACARCNATKGSCQIDDPFHQLHQNSIMCSNYILTGSTEAARRIIQILDLNSPMMIRWRRLFVSIVDLAAKNDPNLFQMLVGLPDTLPNLSRLRPPSNLRPEGVKESWYARQCRE